MMGDFPKRLAEAARATETLLGKLVSRATLPGETERPARLIAAMRHALLGPGKRLRPFLLIESARLFGTSGEGVIRAAAALECVHCYSLVHDDLPAMDDDDMRRGKPSVHKAFDEATAVLAGDALLTIAFAILADPATDPDPKIRLTLISGLAKAAGVGGMVGGQHLDLAAEKRAPSERAIAKMQAMKTGALFRYACEAGAIVARAPPKQLKLLANFGSALGLIFQRADDLIDKDAEREKATRKGVRSQKQAVAAAIRALAPLGPKADMLAEAARFAGNRDA